MLPRKNLIAIAIFTFLKSEALVKRMSVSRKSFFAEKLMASLMPFNRSATKGDGDSSWRGTSIVETVSSAAAPRTATNISTFGNCCNVAYRSVEISIQNGASFTQVPVSIWYPVEHNNGNTLSFTVGNDVKYKYTISVSKISKLIAGWNLPRFLKRTFALNPIRFVVDGSLISLPASAPVLVLAHGYLGSRFDLCHVAEVMAKEGFVCVSAEYPESLAASYDSVGGLLLRSVITSQMLQTLREEYNTFPTSYGIIGHSLGCHTVMNSGNPHWTRVCIAGAPAATCSSCLDEISPILCIASINDGAVPWSRIKPFVAGSYFLFDLGDTEIVLNQQLDLPLRSVSLFQNSSTAPNHISFLAENVNDSMVSFLAVLLPLAKTLRLPVLDFDKYKESRDSMQTATTVIPLIRRFLLQNMVTNS